MLGPARGPLLLTRPRHFGKTLTQTTLRSFLQLNYEHPGAPNADAELFGDLVVSQDTQLCAQYQSGFPVIFLTLKDVQQSAFQSAYNKLCGRVSALCREFAFLAEAPQLSPFQRRKLELCMQLSEVDDRDGRREELLTSGLLLLAQCLHTIYKRPAYILIDDHDVPLCWAAHYSTPQDRSHYERMRELVFGMLGEVINTGDPAVRRCILTSCLRLNPPGSSSGLNNLLELGMEDHSCAQLIGFTQAEVDQLLNVHGLGDHRKAVHGWYDGYLCGGTRLYNPWSVMHYCRTALSNPAAPPRNYWVDTSSNDFRRYFISELSEGSMSALQGLLDGGSVALNLRPGLDCPDLDAAECDDRDFFTLLYQTGYLTRSESRGKYGAERYVIPNCEVLDCFSDKIYDYFRQSAVRTNPRFTALITAFLDGNSSAVQSALIWLYTHYLDMQVADSRLHRARLAAATAGEASHEDDLMEEEEFDEPECQALIEGLLNMFDGAAIADLAMERRLGTGWVDISFVGSGAASATACLLAFRDASDESDESLVSAAERALTRTRDDDCAAALFGANSRLEIIYSYGIGCWAEDCWVQTEVIRRSQI